MKKIFILLSIIGLLTACGGEKAKPENKEQDVPQAKVIDKSGDQPAWILAGEEIGTMDNKKVIFFTGYGESKTRQEAVAAAELNAAASAAKAMKAVATVEVAKAWESIGSGDDEQKEQVMKGLEALSAKNVDTSGLLKSGTYWRQVSKPKIVNGKAAGWGTPLYEVYIRYALDYDQYVKIRDSVVVMPTEKKKPVEEKKVVEEKKEEPKRVVEEEKRETTDVAVPEKEEPKKKETIRMNVNKKSKFEEVE
ncbi:MAG TPA: hypothetical protein DHW82_12890 [Spirochaetia bacterium]|nr:MAG: hypothetical protein A2Y41_12740 [Spirochaetes bacterium GWB1_36_13]HCL57886.1 hypothetical protein [Spirochaetia bacterium]